MRRAGAAVLPPLPFSYCGSTLQYCGSTLQYCDSTLSELAREVILPPTCREDAAPLLSEFCCSHGMTWLNEFTRHGVDVGRERCMVWGDSCCQLRVARGKK